MKMKWKFSALALCTAVSFTTFNAAAGTTADISVIGTIAPASCEPTLSNGSVVNYGSISSSSLTAVAPALNQLGSKKISLTITCTGQTLVAIKASDNRMESLVTLSETTYISDAGANSATVADSEFAYGLGFASNNVKIGAWTMGINVANTTVTDGADAAFDADILSTRDNATAAGATWSKSASGLIYSHTGTIPNYLTFAKKGTLAPVAIKTATLPMFVSAAVQPMSAFTANETITLNGNATISLVYL